MSSMVTPQTDRGYTTLLRHLHRPSAAILTQLDGFQASIAYYLAYGQQNQRSPTPLAAAIVGSSMFQFSDQTDVETINARLEMLLSAFRRSVHYKVHALLGKPDPTNPSVPTSSSSPQGFLSSVFSLPLESKVSNWTRDVLNGLQGGPSFVKFACLGGLLIGLEDLEKQKAARKAGYVTDSDGNGEVDEVVAVRHRTRGRVEEEVIVALAEVMEGYPSPFINQSTDGKGTKPDWESEFTQGRSGKSKSVVATLVFVLSSRVLPLVAEDRLRALPLEIFLPSLLGTISSALRGGKIFQGFLETRSNRIMGPGSQFAQDLAVVTSSPQYRSVKSLAELFARATWSFVTAKTQHLWPVLNEIVLVFEEITHNLQDAWIHNPWVDVQKEEEIPESARETLTQAWGILKTVLFTTVMVQQSVVTATTYLPPPSQRTLLSLESNITPASIALTLLQALSNLSFVITKFGGVTSTARTSVFPQLRRLFYSALDVLSTDQAASEKFVLGLCQTGRRDPTSSRLSGAMGSAQMAFSLACIEQLVPNISGEEIQSQILDMCVPNLWDHENREVYESSHSVILALLAGHTQRIEGGPGTGRTADVCPNLRSNGKGKGRTTVIARPLAEKIVPFYTNCLLENSVEGRLIDAQLRVAFVALVRGAGPSGDAEGDTLVWFCIQSLLDLLSTLSPHATSDPNSAIQGDPERAHRLRLMLVSSLPAIPFRLLPRGLEEIGKCMVDESEKSKREELAGEVLKEILENVGDKEKVIVMEWWQNNCGSFFC